MKKMIEQLLKRLGLLKPKQNMGKYYYAYHVKLSPGKDFTLDNLVTTLHAILNDDELIHRPNFPAHITIEGISLDELKRCVRNFTVRKGNIPDSGYSWKLKYNPVIAGNKYPEVHVLLTEVR